LSFYYKNRNYGGMLQAYALCKTLTMLGIQSEQICYAPYISVRGWLQRVKRFCYYLMHPDELLERIKIFNKNRDKQKQQKLLAGKYEYILPKIQIRESIFDKFADECVPHSQQVYSGNIVDCIDKYNAFVVGSDQVWTWIYPAYVLDFVPDDKIKISYAASCAKTELNEYEKNLFRRHLPRFNAISVREENTVRLLQQYAGGKRIEWVLDPTLLLDKEDWDEICHDRLVKDKYVFCYFLGSDKRMRDIAIEYSNKHNMKLVTLPHLHGCIEANDIDFGDEQLYEVGPREFVTLIKHADTVFTDSFHGTVFSLIYQKQFYTFSRIEQNNKSGNDMNNRLDTLVSLFGIDEHVLITDDEFSILVVEKSKPIDYSQPFPKFEEMREKSLKFLRENLAK